jgi:hypothetical protein
MKSQLYEKNCINCDKSLNCGHCLRLATVEQLTRIANSLENLVSDKTSHMGIVIERQLKNNEK